MQISRVVVARKLIVVGLPPGAELKAVVRRKVVVVDLSVGVVSILCVLAGACPVE